MLKNIKLIYASIPNKDILLIISSFIILSSLNVIKNNNSSNSFPFEISLFFIYAKK